MLSVLDSCVRGTTGWSKGKHSWTLKFGDDRDQNLEPLMYMIMVCTFDWFLAFLAVLGVCHGICVGFFFFKGDCIDTVDADLGKTDK